MKMRNSSAQIMNQMSAQENLYHSFENPHPRSRTAQNYYEIPDSRPPNTRQFFDMPYSAHPNPNQQSNNQNPLFRNQPRPSCPYFLSQPQQPRLGNNCRWNSYDGSAPQPQFQRQHQLPRSPYPLMSREINFPGTQTGSFRGTSRICSKMRVRRPAVMTPKTEPAEPPKSDIPLKTTTTNSEDVVAKSDVSIPKIAVKSCEIVVAGGESKIVNFNTGSDEKVEIVTTEKYFQGPVTNLSDDFGFVSPDIFFQICVVAGELPKLGDQVFVIAEPIQNMPFKWRCRKVLKYESKPGLATRGVLPSQNPEKEFQSLTLTPISTFPNQNPNHFSVAKSAKIEEEFEKTEELKEKPAGEGGGQSRESQVDKNPNPVSQICTTTCSKCAKEYIFIDLVNEENVAGGDGLLNSKATIKTELCQQSTPADPVTSHNQSEPSQFVSVTPTPLSKALLPGNSIHCSEMTSTIQAPNRSIIARLRKKWTRPMVEVLSKSFKKTKVNSSNRSKAKIKTGQDLKNLKQQVVSELRETREECGESSKIVASENTCISADFPPPNGDNSPNFTTEMPFPVSPVKINSEMFAESDSASDPTPLENPAILESVAVAVIEIPKEPKKRTLETEIADFHPGKLGLKIKKEKLEEKAMDKEESCSSNKNIGNDGELQFVPEIGDPSPIASQDFEGMTAAAVEIKTEKLEEITDTQETKNSDNDESVEFESIQLEKAKILQHLEEFRKTIKIEKQEKQIEEMQEMVRKIKEGKFCEIPASLPTKSPAAPSSETSTIESDIPTPPDAPVVPKPPDSPETDEKSNPTQTVPPAAMSSSNHSKNPEMTKSTTDDDNNIGPTEGITKIVVPEVPEMSGGESGVAHYSHQKSCKRSRSQLRKEDSKSKNYRQRERTPDQNGSARTRGLMVRRFGPNHERRDVRSRKRSRSRSLSPSSPHFSRYKFLEKKRKLREAKELASLKSAYRSRKGRKMADSLWNYSRPRLPDYNREGRSRSRSRSSSRDQRRRSQPRSHAGAAPTALAYVSSREPVFVVKNEYCEWWRHEEDSITDSRSRSSWTSNY